VTEAQTVDRSCSDSDCKVSETGKCVNDLPLDQCPHYQQKNEVPQIESSLVGHRPENDAVHGAVKLNDGRPLLPARANSILRQSQTTIIGLVGPPDSGKTSLIARVYDDLQYAKEGGPRFASSSTLVAFEEICFGLRAASHAEKPYISRTPVAAEPFFYHLALNDGTRALPCTLLLADRAGELYQNLIDTPGSAGSYVELNRAAILNLLVDGKRLSEIATRASTLASVRQMLDVLCETRDISENTRLNIVLTKLDRVRSVGVEAEIDGALNSIVEASTRRYRNGFNEIRIHKIAAIPESSDAEDGEGVRGLVEDWISGMTGNPMVTLSNKAHSARSMGRISRERLDD